MSKYNEEVNFKLSASDASIHLLEMMRECSTYLDRKYGSVLGGSPLLTDIIKAHFEADPNRGYALYGMSLIHAAEELRRSILHEDQQRTTNEMNK